MKKRIGLAPAITDLYDSPTFRLMRNLEDSPALRAVRELQKSGVLDDLTRAAQSQRALVDSLNSPSWVRMQSEMSELARVISQSPSLTGAVAVNADLARCITKITVPVLPDLANTTEMTRALSESLQPFQSDVSGWSKRLQEQISLLREPWALAGIESVSVAGFARISNLSSYAHLQSPFGVEAAAYYRDQLFTPDDELAGEPAEKDDAAVEAGLNPELIAFYPSEYSHVLTAAGFSVSFSRVRVPVSEGRENRGEAYNPAHDALLKQVEILLRQLIEQSLRSLSGDAWIKQRVPGQMKKKWSETHKYEHEKTGNSYDLIQYADFMDLADLICQTNNWNEAFSHLFVSREDFRISMARLHPIRKSLAHARPLARSEVLLLVSEASRILTVLRSVLP